METLVDQHTSRFCGKIIKTDKFPGNLLLFTG